MLSSISFKINGLKSLLATLLLVTFSGDLCAQELLTVCKLPSKISESSGLIVLDENNFLTHNDGGDKPVIYLIDSFGNIVQETFVKNAQNIDWEDVTINHDGQVFIGDFGNNSHNRKDLKIYMLPPYNQWGDTVNAEKIHFQYARQKLFPPDDSKKYFDGESLAFANDSFCIISKNWSNPYSGFAYLYAFSFSNDSLSLTPVDSLYTGSIKEISWVTSAAATDSFLYMLSSAHFWKVDITKGLNFNSVTQYPLNHFSQKEAISVYKGAIYITDEGAGGFGNLYKYGKQNFSSVESKFKSKLVTAYYNGDKIIIKNRGPLSLKYQLLDITGKILMKGQTESESTIIDTHSILNNTVCVLEMCDGINKPLYLKIKK